MRVITDEAYDAADRFITRHSLLTAMAFGAIWCGVGVGLVMLVRLLGG